MKFITNRVFFGTPKSSPIAEKIKTAGAQAGQVKTASAAQPEVKEANIANLKDYAHPKGGKAKKEAPKVEEEVVANGETEIKVAEGKEEGVEKYEAGKKEATEFTNDAEKKPEDAEKPEKEAGKAATTTTKTQDGSFPSSGQPQWEGKPENNNSPEMPTDKNTKASAEELLKRVLAGLNGKSFEKIANMKPEVKKDFEEYWKSLYDGDYVSAMAADK